jgi:hypothetical protein
MKKNIELKTITEALGRVREVFYDYGKDILDKISVYQETGTISGYLGDPTFDYAALSKVMQGGFHSAVLRLLSESLIYLHYFCDVYDTSLDLKNFISHRRFDSDTFEKKAKKHANLSIDLNILELYANRSMRNLSINPLSCKKVLRSGESILDTLNVFKYAMSIKLHHYGDKTFLVSKIPLGSDHPFDVELLLNPHIFYTEKPEQIISFAQQAKPGVYILANCPEGNHAETAFYILFRQKGYAYLVENSKHSYRDQYYRDRSNGTPGQDAWLDRKYEYCYLPIEKVINFFNKKTESKTVSLFDGFNMISLGKVTDCSPHTTLYTYAFMDKCFSYFKDNEFSANISNTSCIGFVSQLLKGSTDNVPAIAATMLPTLSEFDISWSPEEMGIRKYSDNFEKVEPELPVIQTTDLSMLPQGSLTSIEHLKRSVKYRNRLASAKELEYQWNKDFKENLQKVLDTVGLFIRKRGLTFVVRKSLQNLTYRLRGYKCFGYNSNLMDESGYTNITILDGVDKKRKDDKGSYIRTHNLSGYTSLHQSFGSSLDRAFAFDRSYVSSKLLCNHCGDTYARYHYTLQFLDWEIFREFFEIKENEMQYIPDQFKMYLNQASNEYCGNSLLEDLDPIALIKNPWFIKTLNNNGEIIDRSRKNPAYLINYFLCGNCQKSIMKVGKK